MENLARAMFDACFAKIELKDRFNEQELRKYLQDNLEIIKPGEEVFLSYTDAMTALLEIPLIKNMDDKTSQKMMADYFSKAEHYVAYILSKIQKKKIKKSDLVDIILETSFFKNNPVHDEYGFLTKFYGITEDEAVKRIDTMVDVYHIKDFQFYDVFFNYSQPKSPSSSMWETKVSRILASNHIIDLRIVRAYIDQILIRGGRSWLYVQAVGAEEPDLRDFVVLPYQHKVNNEVLFTCYFPDERWAARMCTIWAPFAIELGFNGIHWDSLGYLNGMHNNGNVFSSFLRKTKELLSKQNLLQTFNFVDGFGWDASLIDANILQFPYWEVWTLPYVEDIFFDEMFNLDLQKTNKGVFVCYPVGKHNPCDIPPIQLAHKRHAKCKNTKNCRYLLFGDGNRMIKTEYFPDNSQIDKFI